MVNVKARAARESQITKRRSLNEENRDYNKGRNLSKQKRPYSRELPYRLITLSFRRCRCAETVPKKSIEGNVVFEKSRVMS